MFLVDATVLLAAADASSPVHRPCREALERWREAPGAWFTSWGTLFELLRAATHPRVLRRPWTGPEAWAFVEALLASPGLQVISPTPRHLDVAREVLGELPWLAGNLFPAAHLAVLMREHGVRRIYSRDAELHRFPFLEVVDPAALPRAAG
ncbi:MAG TPA: TA system VapC family ribonuclease toxin [Anaeromyxobacteraceae bacterium]|nr:TA system VapC family ribonuclease toxin [Anaeromyxobacteraceae bacterium]